MSARDSIYRTCIGCRKIKSKADLIRIVIKNSEIIVDPKNKLLGRGAYVCKLKIKNSKLIHSTSSGLMLSKAEALKINRSCLDLAIKKNAFKYAFRKKIKPDQKLSASATDSIYFGTC